MSMVNYLKNSCPHCAGHVEFEADSIGAKIQFPHCQSSFVLSNPYGPARNLKSPKNHPAVIPLAIILPIVAVIILALWRFGNEQVYSALGIVMAVGGVSTLYFLPAIMGRHKRNAQTILILNLFLGWTFIGWVVALIWAATVDPESAKNP